MALQEYLKESGQQHHFDQMSQSAYLDAISLDTRLDSIFFFENLNLIFFNLFFLLCSAVGNDKKLVNDANDDDIDHEESK